MAMDEKTKQERLEGLREEHERLSREGILLVDAGEFYNIQEVVNRRREIMKRIDELETCITRTKQEATQ